MPRKPEHGLTPQWRSLMRKALLLDPDTEAQKAVEGNQSDDLRSTVAQLFVDKHEFYKALDAIQDGRT
jgi:hypothetical protein